MMRKVIYSLIPIYLFSFYLYGLDLIRLSIFVFGFGIFTEYIMERKKKKKVSEAILVTNLLFVLSLPPKTPLWIASIGIVFGVLFAKEVYGGFGRNIFNPAIAGRLFIYIAFAGVMTSGWAELGFFNDVVTTATPLDLLRNGQNISLYKLFFGFRAGSMGEGSILLILLAAIYLIKTKTASWRIITSTFLSGLVLTSILFFIGIKSALPPISGLMSGSFMFVTIFMATDPITAPKKAKAQWFYGFIIGITAVLVRTFSLFSEGTSFGILMGNTFASLLDEYAKKVKS
ncbi:RnfABCDGE type electron transport complex subunit D [Tepiditoga spiralis]